MGFAKRKQIKERFAGIPHYAMKCDSYISLSYSAKALLLELAYQYNGKNNGDLIITHSWFKSRGFKSNTTMYKARDELYQKGFIVINAYGGKSAGGKKLPTLYALTWASVNELKSKCNQFRFTHYPIDKNPLKYFIQGENPDYKPKKKKDKQYLKDIKAMMDKTEINCYD